MAVAVTQERRGAGGTLVDAPAVGVRIKALREAMGLSLRDLAERSGVSAPMLSQVERGETSPTLAVAARIAAGLELTLSQLLRLDEDRHVVIIRRGEGPAPRAGGGAPPGGDHRWGRGPQAPGGGARGGGAAPAAAGPASRRLTASAGPRRGDRRSRRSAAPRAGEPRDGGRPRWGAD